MDTGVTVDFAAVHPKPNTIRLTPDGRVLIVSSRGPNNPVNWLDPGPEWGAITLLDTATGKPLDLFVAGNQPTGMDLSLDGRSLAASDFIDNRVRIFELPATDDLLAGHGGRSAEASGELKKVDWAGWVQEASTGSEP